MICRMLKVLITIAVILSTVVMITAYPIYNDEDLHQAASGDEHHGRVQIKVYRGPTEHSGHDYFAPWGYWVKQPADH